MRIPPIFASVSLRRRENVPTFPPSDARKSLRQKNARAINRPGVAHRRRLEVIVTRITLLALFFVSVVGFTLEHAQINLLLMSASALAILLWNGLWKP
jgi:hypothetical protein